MHVHITIHHEWAMPLCLRRVAAGTQLGPGTRLGCRSETETRCELRDGSEIRVWQPYKRLVEWVHRHVSTHSKSCRHKSMPILEALHRRYRPTPLFVINCWLAKRSYVRSAPCVHNTPSPSFNCPWWAVPPCESANSACTPNDMMNERMACAFKLTKLNITACSINLVLRHFSKKKIRVAPANSESAWFSATSAKT
jgi:hypothetical protein